LPRACGRARAAADDRSRGGGRRQLPLVDARRDRGDGRARDTARLLEARAYDPQRVTAVLVVVHLLAATVWVGGSTALIFVGVPAIRTLEGAPRGRAMKELGLRWRPLGYGALAVAALTGISLAAREWRHETAFQVVFWTKFVVFVALVAASYSHNFVLGPRLQ